jgi:hypothetical protein
MASIVLGFTLLFMVILVAALWISGEPSRGGKPVSYRISQMGIADGPTGQLIGETAWLHIPTVVSGVPIVFGLDKV